ncbi:transcription factor SPT20 homolog [Dreissena polymorpha]|uniref:NodB homology domain-containing protein n=1 Tax=Dreissena polymorpha TaxID=45954 RepID=A0A9D4KKT4_DREPO|nr:transcription factor SPT20 homolog [Dreissena polymorpha]KAH3841703.1 hypothetical protein DPMN_115176 [Dreissena polymorpha]
MYSGNVIKTIIFLAFIAACKCALPSACVACKQSRRCLPPDCYCCSDELTISNVTLTQIPQMVFFTFDDAVTGQAAGFYKQLFDTSRKNPNGCPISMTLFISHENTQYALVTEFHGLGMEIAAHSVTHSTMNGSNFFEEAKAQKENLAKLAGIPVEDITGWRSPFLKPTGDLQPDTLKNLGYKYDATLTFSKRSLREKPPGPFTLDFGFPYECQVKPCPKSKHPGFWEIPVVSLMDYKQAYDCVYVDGCMNAPPDEDSAYKFLWDNFLSYYTTTKMPFGINMHSSWFYYPDRLKAMDRFIQKLVSLNDVYIVSVSKMIEWLKRPTPLQDLHSFAPWACDGRERAFETGPRLVQTIGVPSPIPRSFIQWSDGPTVVHTPMPFSGTQRTFSQTRPLSQQTITRDLSQAQTNVFSDQDLPRRLQTQLRQTERPRFTPRTSDQMFNPRRPDAVERLSSPTIGPSPRSQDFLLEQHEERLRQQRILEERLRQQQGDIERQRLREAEMQSQMETERLRRLDFAQQQQQAAERQRQLEFERRRQIEAERQRQQEEDRRHALQQQLEAERQAVQQRVLRERQQQLHDQRQLERQQQLIEQRHLDRNAMLQEQQLHRRHELLMQQRQQERGGSGQIMTSPQDTIRNPPPEVPINNNILWKPVIPSSIPDEVISRVENRRHWVPQNVQQETTNIGRSLEVSNTLRPDATQQTGVNLLQRIETPSKVGYITPAPPRVQSLITLRFSESPRDAWLSNMQAARGLSPNAPRSGRGGSNRRTGDQLQQTIPAQLQDQNVRQSTVSGGNMPSRQLNVMTPHASNRIPSQSIGRTIAHPNIAQQIAWHNFIRQMLGPH